jgi:hypothetical protein
MDSPENIPNPEPKPTENVSTAWKPTAAAYSDLTRPPLQLSHPCPPPGAPPFECDVCEGDEYIGPGSASNPLPPGK